ncbi:MAG TPA: alpha/beta hydrolase-fold protein, partial [Nitriliruptorales bacterium]
TEAVPDATFAPVPGEARTYELRFFSEVLGIETTSLVVLPPTYREHGLRSPVAYYLHDRTPEGSARDEVTRLPLTTEDAAQRFVVVAPDVGEQAWCRLCLWIDAANGLGLDADSFLHDELVPVVEANLNVRSDRGGRGVFGSVMGGTGALIQALRHPDRFVFAGAFGPTIDLAGSDLPATDEASLATQGVPPLAVAEALHRNLSPADLASDAVNAGIEVLLSVGNGCATAGAGCSSATPAVLADEAHRAAIAERVSPVWTELGFPHTLLRFDGVTGASDGEVFAGRYVARMNTVFARPAEDPWWFSYKTTDRSFDVWGYRFDVDRPNTEFLHVLGARRDGRGLILSGTGSAQVTTPGRFRPGRSYRVVTTADPRAEDPLDPGVAVNPYHDVSQTVTADATGRLRFDVPLAATRLTDEREAALHAGAHTLEHVRVQVHDVHGPPGGREDTPDVVPTGPLHRDPALLPAPFAAWDVTLEVAANAGNPARSPQILRLSFDSPSIGADVWTHLTGPRTSTMIYLPDRYVETDEPLPVVYHLHGTGHGNQHFNLRLHELLGTLGFVVVVPDAGGSVSWCKDCQWVDRRAVTDHPLDAQVPGAGEGGGPGDTYLHTELIPLVEELFHVRTDRASRAVIGNSMGALGALNQALRHPDRFAFAGALSGWLDHGSPDTGHTPQWLTYFESQRYPLQEQAPALYRDVSPLHTAPVALGANIQVVASVGDGCVGTEGWCWGPHNPASSDLLYSEILANNNHSLVAPRLDTLGMPWTHARWRGVHWSPDGDVFRAYYLPRLERVFDDPPPEPERFSFKTTRTAFAAWGYDIEIDRPNHDFEFLNLLGARRDGREFTLAGTGRARIATPPAFEPGTAYAVRLTRDGNPDPVAHLVADAAGRLVLDVVLGPGRELPEHEPLVAAGAFPFPHTRVEINPTAS